jgi:hypothetical protein
VSEEKNLDEFTSRRIQELFGSRSSSVIASNNSVIVKDDSALDGDKTNVCQ